MIVNLTIPAAQRRSTWPRSIRASTSTRRSRSRRPADGQRTVELAAEKGLRVGSAPDTFLGGSLQTCRKLIDDGAIGVPVAAVAFMAGHEPEGWHPDPDFFYKPGAGPCSTWAGTT